MDITAQPEKQPHCEQRPPEEWSCLLQTVISWIRLMQLLEGDQVTEVLLEAVPDQGEVASDIVDNAAEAGKTGGDDGFVVEQDQLHARLLQLREEDLAGVLDEGDRQLKGASHVGDDLVVALSLASHIEIRLEGLDMIDEQLRSGLCKEEGGCETSHDPVRTSSRLCVPDRCLFGLENSLYETVHNLLAGDHQRLGRLPVHLSCIILVLLWPEKCLQELLKPFQAGVSAGDYHVCDILCFSHQKVFLLLASSTLIHWLEPHVLEDIHHQLPDPLLVIDPPDHLDADLWDSGVVWELQADVLQDLDHSLPDADTSVKDPEQEHLVILVNQLRPMQDELAHKVHGGLPHHGGGVQEGIVDPPLHVVSGEHPRVLLNHQGHAFQRLGPHLDRLLRQHIEDLLEVEVKAVEKRSLCREVPAKQITISDTIPVQRGKHE